MARLTTEQIADRKRRKEYRARPKPPKILRGPEPSNPVPPQVLRAATLANSFYGETLRSYKLALILERSLFAILGDVRDLKKQIKRDNPHLFGGADDT